MTRPPPRGLWDIRWFATYARDVWKYPAPKGRAVHLYKPPHPVYRTDRGTRSLHKSFTLADAVDGEILVCPVCLYSRVSPYAGMATS